MTIIAETSSATISRREDERALHLHHSFVLPLQLLVGGAVLLHRQQRQSAAELAALVLRSPARQLRQQVRGEPGGVRVRHAIGEPGLRGHQVQLHDPAEENINADDQIKTFRAAQEV